VASQSVDSSRTAEILRKQPAEYLDFKNLDPIIKGP
jgi:hypothetical protein